MSHAINLTEEACEDPWGDGAEIGQQGAAKSDEPGTQVRAGG